MMAKYTPGDLEISPYYDRFDDTSNITFVAFVANNILQGHSRTASQYFPFSFTYLIKIANVS